MLLRTDNEPREHDFTKSMWGHALHNPEMVEEKVRPKSLWRRVFGPWDKGQYLRALGHGYVREGDTILVNMASGRVARFKVMEIEYYSDPGDMFKLKRAHFLDYVEPA